jgi:two-component system cell cycle response regulator DivK
MPKKILIIEDNDLNRRLFNDVLLSRGYETVLSSRGSDAFALARDAKPDLIMMDMRMPDADGLDATRQIRSDVVTAHIPVIAVTACAMKGDEQRIRAGGCSDYLSKPVSLSRLLDCVHRHVHWSEAHESI